MSLAYSVDTRGSLAIIRLSGLIDRDAGTILEQAYTAALDSAPETVELDFTDVEYINSTGIALIVSLLARARAQRLPTRALGLTAHYQHIFQITRLSDFIEIVQTADTGQEAAR
ncbi:STAS domain-containing protein [Microbacterium sp. ASV49]|uniref:Anti-sigma factor antagonist n=1 Tax=Microbacterium candidum TaxID=3041922 RepID=A0ABT7N2G1_9MICO|nr:STAS domain-containing protein [Microbacterium sp. ASV49]MDL9980863.1 STAS domain-containing protein [Microbacterium sp. ASV49]